MRLLTKISFIILTGAIVTVVVLGFLVFSSIKTIIQNNIKEQQEELSRQTMDKIDRLVYSYYLGVQNIGEEEHIERTLGGELKDFQVIERRIKELTFLTGPWDLLQIVDAQGKIVVSNVQKKNGKQSVIEGDYNFIAFRQALSGKVYYSDFVLSKETGKPTMVFAAPVRDQEKYGNPIVGAVVGHMSWPIINEILEGVDTPSELNLYSRSGRLISTNIESKRNFSNLDQINKEAGSFIDKVFLSKKSLTVLSTEKEGDFDELISVAKSFGYLGYHGNDWALFIETPVDIAFAPATNQAWKIVLFLMPIFIITVGSVLFFISRFIVKPIVSLTDLTKFISAGNLKKRINLKSNDEIGQLASSFNSMAEKLNDAYKNLEDKINQRTAEIKQERDRSLTIISSMSEGLLVVDSDYKIVLLNRAARKILQMSSLDIAGKDIREILKFSKDNAEIPAAEWPINKLIEEKEPINISVDYGLYCGCNSLFCAANLFPIAITGSPLFAENLVGAVIIFRDITEEKKLDDAKSSFISIASHQLRTPISAINWISEMFLGGDFGELNEKQKKFMQNIYDNNKRSGEFVNVLLATTRLEAGRVGIKSEPTDLLELTKNVLNNLKSLIDAKKINLNLKSSEIPKISLETEMFRQVILNLVSNAINYSRESGRIDIIFEIKDSDVLVTVADDGIGIPKEEQGKIFEKFYRAENAKNFIPNGTGIGLNFCRSIVASWKGKIWFESEKEKGTKFYFTIPLAGVESREGEVKMMD